MHAIVGWKSFVGRWSHIQASPVIIQIWILTLEETLFARLIKTLITWFRLMATTTQSLEFPYSVFSPSPSHLVTTFLCNCFISKMQESLLPLKMKWLWSIALFSQTKPYVTASKRRSFCNHMDVMQSMRRSFCCSKQFCCQCTKCWLDITGISMKFLDIRWFGFLFLKV